MTDESRTFLLIVLVGYLFRALGYLTISSIAWKIFYKKKHKAMKIFPKNWLFIPKFEIKNSLLSLAVFSFSFGAIYLLRDTTKFYLDFNKFGVTYFLIQIVLLVVIHDAWFYWTHRLLHIKKIYTLVHARHHYSVNPTPYAGLSFHPLETILDGAIMPIIIFIIPLHPLAILTWFVIMIFHVTYIHIGFEFMPYWWHKNPLTKWFVTPTHHNIHHGPKGMNTNMGLYFIFWDKVMGTLASDYHQRFEQIVSRRRS